jgi:hypothetical protein
LAPVVGAWRKKKEERKKAKQGAAVKPRNMIKIKNFQKDEK